MIGTPAPRGNVSRSVTKDGIGAFYALLSSEPLGMAVVTERAVRTDFEAELVEVTGENNHNHLYPLATFPPTAAVTRLVNRLAGTGLAVRGRQHGHTDGRASSLRITSTPCSPWWIALGTRVTVMSPTTTDSTD